MFFIRAEGDFFGPARFKVQLSLMDHTIRVNFTSVNVMID